MLDSAGLLVMDSGVGGLSYLPLLRRMMPRLNGIYLADTHFFPYGERSPRDLRNRVCALAKLLYDRWKFSHLVLACNTASVLALEALRSSLPEVEVVGIVPAIKQATFAREGEVVVLATKRTVHADYTKNLARFVAAKPLRYIDASRLVSEIEIQAPNFSADSIQDILNDMQKELYTEGCLVLGCTHFLHIRDLLKSMIPSACIVDSEQGVVKRIVSLMSHSRQEEGKWQLFLTSSQRCAQYKKLAEARVMHFSGYVPLP